MDVKCSSTQKEKKKKAESITLTGLLLLQQLYSENKEVDARFDGANASNMPSSATTCGPFGDQMNHADEPTHAREMDEYPNFDLGF